ncbi:MAG TPA: ABC-2 family transporter protein [Frankiaceae bacterium]|jgi:ABC-2 type transport system permease protein|nr:ABC-2 family transporter protein [Frankiaceae bacterium]
MNARAAWVTVTVAARKGAAERGGLLFTVGFYLLVSWALGSVWRMAAGAGDGEVAGYTAVALTWYIATSEAATIPLNQKLIEDVGLAIGNGSIAVEMLRPASVLGVRVMTELGRSLPRLVVCLVAGSALALVTGGAPPSVAALALVPFALVLAIACNTVSMYAFAGAGFWLRDTRSAWFLYQKLVFLLGGMLLPLQVLPHALERAAHLMPFMAMAYVPARLASGHVEPELLLVQAFWLVVLGLLATRVFAAGERRIATVGG